MTVSEPTHQPISSPTGRHAPVLLDEVLAALSPSAGETFIDGTFGAGGYSRAILQSANCRVLALDRDRVAVRDGQALVAEMAPRLTLIEAPFSTLADVVSHELKVAFVDGVVLDIGVSSMQLDQPERGFSFQTDGPLDMRMSAEGVSAADVVNSFDEDVIANILFDLGDEKKSRHIASAIVRQRAVAPITTTLELSRLVSRVLGGRRDGDRHPATRAFQALRVYVNDELGELEAALAASERILKPGGRLVVVTFHSLEDRIVKTFMAERTGKQTQGSRHLPPSGSAQDEPSFRFVNSRPLSPSQPELDANPRARSARLRSAIRTMAPPWP